MKPDYERRKLVDLQPGDHLCFLYGSDEEHRTVMATFLRQGLDAGEKVIYITDIHNPETILSYLRDTGVAVELYLDRNQLRIFSSDSFIPSGDVFDPEAMFGLLRTETEGSLAEGFSGLRITGEMTWVMRDSAGSAQFQEFGVKLDDFIPESRCLCLCQFDRRRFDPAFLLEVLATHPWVIIGTEVIENLYFQPSGESLSSEGAAIRLAHWLDYLADYQRTLAALEQRTHDLGERVKELNCLFNISSLVNKPGVALKEILQRVVGFIPPAFQYPETTGARITLWDNEVRTANFQETPWLQKSAILVHGAAKGDVEVCYLEERPALDEGPFLKEERRLIDAIAERLGDFIERQEAEEALRQSEIKYRSLVEHIPAIPYTAALDASSTTLYVSPQAKSILGYAPEDFQTDPDIWKNQLHPDDQERVLAELARSHATGEPFASEYRMFTRDGRVVWFRDEAWIVKDADGQPLFLQGVMLDITERRQAEEKLREHKEQLEKLIEERTAELRRANLKLQQEIRERQLIEDALEKGAEKIKIFAYSVIHDLKNPAVGIYGVTNLLKKHYGEMLDARGRKYCDQIMRGSEQIATLLKKINAYIVTKEAPLNIKTIHLKEILQIVKEEFSERLELRQIRWHEPVVIPDIRADGLYVLRALRNLVDNALKYGGEKLSKVTVGYEATDRFHILFIKDDGVGIPLADPEKIFKAFERHETSEGVEGSGLGLAIVKEIAERHGGRVWVESSSGKGTTFYLSISRQG